MKSHRRYVSPLRYPGGKARMAEHLAEVFDAQTGWLDVEVWVEPFAGGAGAGLTLLDRERVGEVWLIEKHPALAAMWRTMLEQPTQLAARVAALVPTMRDWELARETVAASMAGEAMPDFDAALAAFIVNRCSRSGIVTPSAGPIGGKNQSGRWHVASRWNGRALAQRISHVGALSNRIRFWEGDGIDHIVELSDSGIEDEVLVFVDPPYIREGNRLYSNGMTGADHQRLAGALNASPCHWLLTYDNEPRVLTMYPDCRVLAYEIGNTANRARTATEYAVLSDNLQWVGLDELAVANSVRWLGEVRAPAWA